MAAACRDRIKEETVRKAVNALLKWKEKNKFQSQTGHEIAHEEEGEEADDFIYLSITLKKVPPKTLTLTPHKIPLRHSLFSQDYSSLNLCLIVDGKKMNSESAHKMLKAQGIHFINQVLRLSKLKSDYKSFDSKKKLYNSFDVFLAAKSVVPLLPKVLGRIFYKKKRKIPVPVDLRADGSNWKEEIGMAYQSSLLCLSGGTCSVVRLGRWAAMESNQIVENVYGAIDGVLEIVQEKWSRVKCFHLKFSNSLALPIYEDQNTMLSDDNERGKAGDSGFGVVGTKRRRTELLQDPSEKK